MARIHILVVVVLGLAGLSLTSAAAASTAAEETAILVREVSGGALAPVSIDPAGIVYLPHKDRLLISDSEIDETTLFQGVNLWETSRTFQVTRTGVTPDPTGQIEPSGLAYDPQGRRLFVTNDQTDSVFIIGAGADGNLGNGDDLVDEYSTVPLGVFDLGDAAYSTSDGSLFLVDYASRKIHRVHPGANGVFDGPAPAGDDAATVFSLAPYGIFNAEGVGYRASSDTLLVTDSGSMARIFEFTTQGDLLRAIDLSFLRQSGTTLRPADVTVAPASMGSGQSMYVVDRGTDSGNTEDPTPGPQDGRLYELQAPFSNLAPKVSAGPDHSLTLSESVMLAGTVVDDGQPKLGDLQINWTVSEGPGGVTLGRPHSPATVASFNQTGTYVLKLEASDGAFSIGDTVTVQVNPSPSGRFIDDDDSIFENDIEWLAGEGITKGCNPPHNFLFCPQAPVTRGQMAAFLNRALDLTGSAADRFIDDDNSVFEADIQALAAADITLGCNPPANTRFCPDRSVTRGEMAAFLVRALGLPASPADLFADDDESIFEAVIQALAAADITRGCNPPANTRFCPEDPVTREQMAAFLHRALGP